jgi:exosortase/archaeosortase family protein
MYLNIRDFGVTIGGRCAGVEGMTLFTVLFFALLIIDWQKLSKWRALLLFPLGILRMYFANIFRIYLILVLGYEVSVRMGREAAYHLILEHFHSNIGWILYTALILLFFWLALPFLARRARTP